MAMARGSSGDDEDDAKKRLEDELSDLKTAKKHWTKHINKELERFSQREQECVDKLNRLAEEHDREKQQITVKRLSEVESELEQVKCENARLNEQLQKIARDREKQLKTVKQLSEVESELEQVQCENARLEERLQKIASDREKQQKTVKQLSEVESELEQVQCENAILEERLQNVASDREKQQKTVERLSKVEFELEQVQCENAKLKEQLQKIAKPVSNLTSAQRLRTSKVHTLSEPLYYKRAVHEQLRRTKRLWVKTQEELHETQQRLSDVQDRLTVAEQVTAATQQRELQESGISEQLQRELTPQNLPTIHTGFRQNLYLIKCWIYIG